MVSLSQTKGRRGRPCLPTEVRRLIMKMALDNPLWRGPRIHGELQLVGVGRPESPIHLIL
jgi:hypothetical protein